MRLALRFASPIEPYEPYVPFAAWPIIWVLPYGMWTWIIVFTPDMVLRALRWWRESRRPLDVSVKKTGSGVKLLGGDGHLVDRFAHSDVESVTRQQDGRGRTTIRLSRKRGRDLLFLTTSEDEVDDVATSLDLDLTKARGRYRTLSRAARLSVLLILGVGIIVWPLAATPTPEIAMWMGLYTRLVTLPLFVLFAIPTWVEVGRDGIAWRWLFIRKYFAFSSLQAVDAERSIGNPKVLRIFTKDRAKYVLFLAKDFALPLVKHAADAFAAAQRRVEQEPTDAIERRLRRRKKEESLAWISRLRAMGAGEGAYRTASVGDLWRTAEDEAVAIDVRLGALIVLTTSDPGRERARALAARVVDPEIRSIMDAISDPAMGAQQLARLVDSRR
jgi:hypothetical protein